jgi:hypothetical protein
MKQIKLDKTELLEEFDMTDVNSAVDGTQQVANTVTNSAGNILGNLDRNVADGSKYVGNIMHNVGNTMTKVNGLVDQGKQLFGGFTTPVATPVEDAPMSLGAKAATGLGLAGTAALGHGMYVENKKKQNPGY